MEKDHQIHSKILTEAARSVLRPLGLSQKGRSRTWRDDRQWWVGIVEFQPSGWSRGSYLNVGCMWLWSVKDWGSFDEGDRVETFKEFRSETQFRLAAVALAERAAQEVLRYRKMFASPRAVCEFYRKDRPSDFWKQFHAGVASGLCGEMELARRFFRQVTEPDRDDPDWMVAARADAVRLSERSADTDSFRREIVTRIHQTRALQKLEELPTVLFDT